MKWPRWFSRLSTELALGEVAPRRPVGAGAGAAQLGIRDVGHCEVCGRSMQARTRRERFRGRVDCDCGHRNHVEHREVRASAGSESRHVTVTTGRRFEAATHEPDLRLAWRYGVCPGCSMAVRLLDAHVIAHEDALGFSETFAYYCTSCHVHDDARRGRLLGHDGDHVVDMLRFQSPSA